MTKKLEKVENKVKVMDNKNTVTPATLLEIAITQNADLEKLEKLMDLQIHYENYNARKAYHKAMAGFKATAPEIVKDQTVSFKTTHYKHASLFNVTQAINSELTKYGLSAAWHISQPNGHVEVTCTITHELGHSESTSMIAPPDDKSPSMNNVQRVASTVTYLQRYTLLSLTGLATKDSDNDGRGNDAASMRLIDENQTAELLAKINKAGIGLEIVLNEYQVDELAKLSIAQFKECLAKIKFEMDNKR